MNNYTIIFSQDKNFYVYEYLRSRNSKFGNVGTPYYVGKGKENRAFDKHKNIQVPKDKSNIIVSSLMNEADSFQGEILKIQLYGRIDVRTGCLHNKTDGGEGKSGANVSSKTRLIMSVNRSGSKNGMFGKNHSLTVCEASRVRRRKTNQERRWFNNGIETKFLKECPNGWTLGRINQKPTTKDRKWYNNGKVAVISQIKPNGDEWVVGMLRK